MIGRISANFGCVHRHHHVVRVFGTEASFIYDDSGPRLHASRDEHSEPIAMDLATLPQHKGVLIPNFVDAIRLPSLRGPIAQHEFDLISACAHADLAHRQKSSVDIHYEE